MTMFLIYYMEIHEINWNEFIEDKIFKNTN